MSIRRDDEVAGRTLGRFYGKYPAVVVDNNDPEQKYRVKVRCECIFPSGEFDPVVTDWCLPALPPGCFMIPTRGDEVWLEFQHGHLDFPVWGWKFVDPAGGGNIIGTPVGVNQLSNQVASDDGDVSGDYPFVSVYQSPLGQHKLMFFDRSSNKKVRLRSKTAACVELNDNAGSAFLGLGVSGPSDKGFLVDGTQTIVKFGALHIKFQENLVEITDGNSVISLDPSGIAEASNADWSASDKDGGKFRASGGKIAMGNGSAEAMDELDKLINGAQGLADAIKALNDNASTFVSTSVGPGVLNPAIATALTQFISILTTFKTQWTMMKGTL